MTSYNSGSDSEDQENDFIAAMTSNNKNLKQRDKKKIKKSSPIKSASANDSTTVNVGQKVNHPIMMIATTSTLRSENHFPSLPKQTVSKTRQGKDQEIKVESEKQRAFDSRFSSIKDCFARNCSKCKGLYTVRLSKCVDKEYEDHMFVNHIFVNPKCSIMNCRPHYGTLCNSCDPGDDSRSFLRLCRGCKQNAIVWESGCLTKSGKCVNTDCQVHFGDLCSFCDYKARITRCKALRSDEACECWYCRYYTDSQE